MRQERLYLLRFWCDEDEGTPWRSSLENLSGGERTHFATLSKLEGFLETYFATLTTEDVPEADCEGFTP